MQKKLVALAVAGLISAPAMAQSNVTIYGVVDAGFAYGKSDDNKFKGINSGLLSASRIGLKGTEDLGNGLKAKFALEYGINVDTGDGPSGPRQSWIGLEGGFGFVGLGRQYSPGHNYAGMLSAFGGSAGFNPYIDLASGTSIVNSGNGRWDNAISYKSPNFSGFDIQAMYAFGESSDQADDFGSRDLGTAFGIGAGYRNAGLKLAIVYHDIEGGDNELDSNGLPTGAEVEDTKEWMIGAGYDFGFMDLNLTYTDVENAGGVDNVDHKIVYLNAGVPVGVAGKVLLGYSQNKVDRSGDPDYKAKAYALAYTHSLSKRTTAYVGYNYIDNDDYGTFRTPGVKVDGIAGDRDNVDGFAVGLNHKF